MKKHSIIVLFFTAICILSCKNTAQEELEVMYESAKAAYYDKNYEQAFKIAHTCSVLAKERGYNVQRGNALNLLGAITKKQEKHPEALSFYLNAMDVKEAQGDSISMSKTYSNIGNIYYMNEAYEEAIYYHSKAIKIQENAIDSALMQSSYCNIALAYQKNEQLEKAIDYFSKSIAINEAQGDEKRKAYSLNDIGICYKNLKEYTNALEQYDKALEVWRKLENADKIARVNNNIAVVYYHMDSFALAVNYANQVIAFNIEEHQLYAYNTLCYIYTKQKLTNKVIEYAEKAIPLAEKHNNQQELLKAYEHAMEGYFKIKDVDKAQFYAKRLNQLHKTMYNEREEFYKTIIANTKAFKEIEKQHQVYKATLLNSKEWTIKQYYWLITTLVLVVAFVAAGTILIKKHRNLRSVASTFPVYVRKSLAKIGGLSYYAQHFPDDALKRIKTLDRTIDTISDQLFSFEHRVKYGLYAPERFDPGVQINSILKNHYHLAEAKKTSIINNVEEGYFINTHKKTFLRAIELLLQESIKDTKRETMVIVELKPYHEALWLTITDYRPRYKSYYEDTTIIKTLKEMGAVVSIEPQTKELFKIVIAFDLA